MQVGYHLVDSIAATAPFERFVGVRLLYEFNRIGVESKVYELRVYLPDEIS